MHSGAFVWDTNGQSSALPKCDPRLIAECWRYVTRDVVIDTLVSIDSSRTVELNPAFVDTLAGQRFIDADLAGFDIFRVPHASRSRILDDEVIARQEASSQSTMIPVRRAGVIPRLRGQRRVCLIEQAVTATRIEFDVTLTLRFLAEYNGSAETVAEISLAAREMTGRYAIELAEAEDSRPYRVRGEAIELLARRLEPLAECLAWISFLRWAHECELAGTEDFAAQLSAATKDLPVVKTRRIADSRSPLGYHLEVIP